MLTKNKSFVAIFFATLFLVGLAVWVPIKFTADNPYFYANLFNGLRPRAILGTVTYLMTWGNFGFTHGFTILKLIFFWFWLYLIFIQLFQSIFLVSKNNFSQQKLWLIFLGIGFIFAVSPISFLTLSSAAIIDAVPFAILAFIVISKILVSENSHFYKNILVTLLLVVATLTHEINLFGLAILMSWYAWKWGFKKSLVYFSPTILITIFFLSFMASVTTSGESPLGYLQILGKGLSFFWQQSFNIWGILFGGGALWILLSWCALQFIQNGQVAREQKRRLYLVFFILFICFLQLVVAHDTNRLMDLIWLPCILLIQEINLPSLFSTKRRQFFLGCLCILQLITPPMLIFQNGMVPFNCYGLWISSFLPKQEQVEPLKMGPFGLYAINRANLTNLFSAQCKSK